MFECSSRDIRIGLYEHEVDYFEAQAKVQSRRGELDAESSETALFEGC